MISKRTLLVIKTTSVCPLLFVISSVYPSGSYHFTLPVFWKQTTRPPTSIHVNSDFIAKTALAFKTNQASCRRAFKQATVPITIAFAILSKVTTTVGLRSKPQTRVGRNFRLEHSFLKGHTYFLFPLTYVSERVELYISEQMFSYLRGVPT